MAPLRIEADVEIQASADKFFKIFKSQCYHIPNISTTNIQGVEVHEGDWETHGSVKIWKYTIGGKSDQVFKEKIEIDEANKSVSLVGLEGDVFKIYKSYKAIFQAIPKGPTNCVVKNVIEYEKLREDSPDGKIFLDFIVSITKDVEAHLVKA